MKYITLIVVFMACCARPPRELDGLKCNDAGGCIDGYVCIEGECFDEKIADDIEPDDEDSLDAGSGSD